MTLIVCLDNRNGMLFNRRRQSQDSAVCRDVMALSKECLYVSEYSAKLFPEANICQNPLDCAGAGDFCFVEDMDVLPYLENAEKLIVYHWNRHYPADVKFPAEVLENWKITERTEFPGSSHETITREVYLP